MKKTRGCSLRNVGVERRQKIYVEEIKKKDRVSLRAEGETK